MLQALIQQLYDSGITSFAILIVNVIACGFTAVLLVRERKKRRRPRRER